MSGLSNAHALVVGIANYPNLRPLPEPVLNDARQIHATLIDEGLCAYPVDNVTLLLDEQATQAQLRDALANLARRTDSDSLVFIYLSSHGGRIPNGPLAGEYLLPVDARLRSQQALAETSISGSEFTSALRAVSARKLVVVFDCCHAGGIGQPKDTELAGMQTLPERYYELLASGRGRAILASSRDSEVSWILPGAKNSLFTSHLLDGMRGKALGAGGVIRIFDLFDYVQPRVTAEHSDQHPIFKAELEENFAVALYRGGQKVAIPAYATAGDGYEFDAFISYSGDKADGQWLRTSLLPPLESAGLHVAVDFRAPLGVPKLLFSESAIQKSRYTLVILSQAYLASGYAEFENLAAQHLGIEQSHYRLLPVVARPCTPRLGLRMLPILDLSDVDELSDNLDRLIYQLRQAPSKRATSSG
jgi:hypothetical protein